MLKPRQSLPDGDHLLRVVPYQRQRRDGDDNLVGFLPEAFTHRPDESYLSMYWLEYFGGTHAANLATCIAEIKAMRRPNRKTCYGVAQVTTVKRLDQQKRKPVRIVYAPSPNNPSHAAVYLDLPTDPKVYAALALEFYKEHY